VIVHGTNTLSYKVKISAKDQCFLRPLQDFGQGIFFDVNYSIRGNCIDRLIPDVITELI